MKEWEYCVTEFCFDGESVWLADKEQTGNLDEMGKKGWELIALREMAGRTLAIFKRTRREHVPFMEVGWTDENGEVRTRTIG